jgi:hypothetical protein
MLSRCRAFTAASERGRRRNRHHTTFESGLADPELAQIDFDLCQRAAQVGRLLRGQAAVLVEIERPVSH